MASLLRTLLAGIAAVFLIPTIQGKIAATDGITAQLQTPWMDELKAQHVIKGRPNTKSCDSGHFMYDPVYMLERGREAIKYVTKKVIRPPVDVEAVFTGDAGSCTEHGYRVVPLNVTVRFSQRVLRI